MNPIKKLIAIKNYGSNNDTLDEKNSNSDEKQTYYEGGYQAAITAHGASAIFKTCLNDIYEKFKEKCREDKNEQMRLNAPYEEEKEKQKSALNGRVTLKTIKEENKEEIQNQINKIDNDISNVKNAPEKYGIEAKKKPKAQFFIGLLILLPITIYLLVFYISASYSAFFKIFESTSVFESIFDANALSKAINDGWLEAVFVCTIPFAFMGLGYLIHMFQKSKKAGFLKIAALLIVTFIFDAILAYQIESKIYELTKTLIDAPFDLKIAFTKVEFWGIIFAGFVVYIIWGLVFDFVMKEYENIDKIKLFINKLEEDKLNLIKKKEEVSNCIQDLTQEIAEINGKITELQAKIDGFIFPNRKYLLYHAEYVKGWFMAISAEIALPHTKKDQLLKNCEAIANQHLEKHNVANENTENIVYYHNLIK